MDTFQSTTFELAVSLALEMLIFGMSAKLITTPKFARVRAIEDGTL